MSHSDGGLSAIVGPACTGLAILPPEMSGEQQSRDVHRLRAVATDIVNNLGQVGRDGKGRENIRGISQEKVSATMALWLGAKEVVDMRVAMEGSGNGRRA